MGSQNHHIFWATARSSNGPVAEGVALEIMFEKNITGNISLEMWRPIMGRCFMEGKTKGYKDKKEQLKIHI